MQSERELRRKVAALAETAALLVLKKGVFREFRDDHVIPGSPLDIIKGMEVGHGRRPMSRRGAVSAA